MPRRRRKASVQCLNCGTAMQEGDHFCRHCGQENHDLRVPFRHFAYEFVESLTHFDTKLWSTLKMIFTKPGQLTKDFVEGKRARYVKPAQFYVFVSIVFFALLTWTVDHGLEKGGEVVHVTSSGPEVELGDAIRDSLREALQWDSLPMRATMLPITAPAYRRTSDRLRTATDATLDSLLKKAEGDTTQALRATLRTALAALPVADSLALPYGVPVNGIVISFKDKAEEQALRDRVGRFTNAQVDSLLKANGQEGSWLQRRMFRALGNVDQKTPAGRKQVVHAVIKAVSFVMFLLMPFTAVLLLWIFYHKRYYWEHLIFAVHIHTIYFLFGALVLAIGLLLPDGLPDGFVFVLVAVCLLYLLLSLRRVYGKSWGATLLRTVLMGLPYFFVGSLLMIIGMVWGFFSL